jgi:hypothetical protein
MNHFKKVLFFIFITGIGVLSIVHAQLLSSDTSISTKLNSSSLDFGDFSNATTTNQTFNSVSLSHITCAHNLSSKLNSIYKSLNIAQAKSLADSDVNFQSITSGFNYTFSSVFLESSFNTTSCDNVIVNDVNLVHEVYDKKGKTIYLAITTFDPSLSKIIEVTKQEPRYQTSSASYSPNWSGYEVGASSLNYPSTLPSTTVYEAEEEHNVQQVQVPFDPANACSNSSDYCDSSIWAGLEDKFGAYPDQNLVQGGSEAKIVSSVVTYDVWYEFLPHGEVPCTNVSVSANDDIVTDVLNNAEGGGSNTTYTVNVVDMNQPGKDCFGTATNYPMSKPVLASFIVERPTDYPHNNEVILPEYSFNPSITGYMYYNGTLNTISNSYTHNEYVTDTMRNPVSSVHGVQNLVPGSVNSGGTFTDTWQSSTNTCAPPQSGDWDITSNCIPGVNINATGNNVVVDDDSVLTIANNTKLTIDLSQNHLLVKYGSGILITSGSKISK